MMRLSILKHLDKKLEHLPDPERMQIKSLFYEFTAMFPDDHSSWS